MTGCRLGCAVAGLAAASRGDAYLAATLITLGAVTDGLDGAAARWLGGGTTFGVWFDYVADYACYVAAPWSLSRLIVPGTGVVGEIALALPLATAAVRYARNGMLLARACAHAPDLPGLGTVFTAFVPVTAFFLGVLPADYRGGSLIFIGMIVVFALLMNSPVRFPKLTKFRGASPAVLVLLAIEPFWMTREIAAATLLIGLAYVLLAGRSPRAPGAPAHTSRTRAAI